jgi:hypothetical protein
MLQLLRFAVSRDGGVMGSVLRERQTRKINERANEQSAAV